jgi:1,4-alpha-glucan branching enzyme
MRAVGDKTLMMWLADGLVYTHMSVLSPPSLEIDRAIAVHKLILSFSWILGELLFVVFVR